MKGRSVIELMTLMLTATVCVWILLTAVTVAFVEIRDPSVDTSAVVVALSHLVVAILGALLGLLAGRSERGAILHQQPTGQVDDL